MLQIFGMLSLKIGYRILNCIINLWFLIFGFYLSLGVPSSSFQSHFLLQLLFRMLIPIWNSFVSVVIFIGLRFFRLECITDFAKTGQVSDDTINLINY